MIRDSAEKCSLQTERGEEEFLIDSILWVESKGMNEYSPCVLHTDFGDVVCSQHFEKILPKLGSSFLFCLPRGAVNQLRIKSFLGQTIELDTGVTLTVEPFLASRYQETYCRNLAQWVWED